MKFQYYKLRETIPVRRIVVGSIMEINNISCTCNNNAKKVDLRKVITILKSSSIV